uniref:Uncharacterized protein n=2 Tax=Chromera velia CCMP2878 TaxID=1169474 RepID=A0A0K6S6A5_9ALVE|eukprot:Cvel_16911.t2-p1 / transcript=Cvel_16911.t2 / gene=Cvel_16911 / organism=Chromera_velia_CCMP2878 / gene_product=hypothetical protein / transcript_product=hypothetical protein / location=Cvel_scaffold1324:9581-10579(-) / protein_length=333 / sequence_SO=supercontig / SO=protein_coding / is_pseudo=false
MLAPTPAAAAALGMGGRNDMRGVFSHPRGGASLIKETKEGVVALPPYLRPFSPPNGDQFRDMEDDDWEVFVGGRKKKWEAAEEERVRALQRAEEEKKAKELVALPRYVHPFSPLNRDHFGDMEDDDWEVFVGRRKKKWEAAEEERVRALQRVEEEKKGKELAALPPYVRPFSPPNRDHFGDMEDDDWEVFVGRRKKKWEAAEEERVRALQRAEEEKKAKELAALPRYVRPFFSSNRDHFGDMEDDDWEVFVVRRKEKWETAEEERVKALEKDKHPMPPPKNPPVFVRDSTDGKKERVTVVDGKEIILHVHPSLGGAAPEDDGPPFSECSSQQS